MDTGNAGALINCAVSTATTGQMNAGPYGLTIGDDKLWVTNGNDVTMCDVSPTDGSLSNCLKGTPGSLSLPVGIRIFLP